MHRAARGADDSTPPTSSSSSSRPGCATSSRACARRSSASRWSASREEDYDLIGLDEDPLEASVQVFYVRKGRVVGRKGLDRRQGRRRRDARARRPRRRAALRRRAARKTCPKEILVPVEPDDLELYEEFLSLNRGSKVRIRVPQRGGKRELLADRDAQRAGVVPAAQAAPRVRPQRARPRAARAPGGARPARGAAAHRVLRHLEHPGHRDRRRRWS